MKQGLPLTNVPAIEDKPKENGQLETADQLNNSHHKVLYKRFSNSIYKSWKLLVKTNRTLVVLSGHVLFLNVFIILCDFLSISGLQEPSFIIIFIINLEFNLKLSTTIYDD